MAEATATASLTAPYASPISGSRTKNDAQSHRPKCKDASKVSASSGIAKKKQSKSRNGCVTCKSKRLKCDEVKPTCEQCIKRGVVCGGYKKNFKWRPFEEPGCTRKNPTKARKDSASANLLSARSHNSYHASTYSPYHDSTTTVLTAQYAPAHLEMPNIHDQPPTAPIMCRSITSADSMYTTPTLTPFAVTPQSISFIDPFTPSFQEGCSFHRDGIVHSGRAGVAAPSILTAGQSPRLSDLLYSGTDFCAPPEEYLSYRNQHEEVYQTTGHTPQEEFGEPDVEEIPRKSRYNVGSWSLRHSSPTPSTSSNSSVGSQDYPMHQQPQHAVTAPETISKRFHSETCGVLSVKDGPTENPWRTLVWPLARDCPALYHAIASMTSFHQSAQFPPMRVQGIDHMRTAVHALAEGLQNMRFDAAISTTLVLAFAESWDVHISTGINHIKGAKLLINQALVQHQHVPKEGEDWTRLKFLCNTWIYMDVIARLTSTDDDESNDVDIIYDNIHTAGHMETSLDPLMGCAHSLFPIIGRVATLARKVRRTSRVSSDLISQATRLKCQLEEWTPPSYIENPEDESTSPRDSIRTATAYQYATLLYLHQTVPEIPSPSAFVLAKRALCELAAVEPSSRSCIIHIYPLMAAGCEMIEEEDRAWVTQRWELLSSRMKLGIIEKSLTVTKELWARRDAYAEQRNVFEGRYEHKVSSATGSLKRNLDEYMEYEDDEVCWFGSRSKRRDAAGSRAQQSTPITHSFEEESQTDRYVPNGNPGLLDAEFTVKGRLHWLGVMQDWNWEVLLG